MGLYTVKMAHNPRTLETFLYNHRSDKKGQETHTRIPDNSKRIYGGKFCIPPADLPEFYRLYHDKVFLARQPEYLTEKQLPEGGPILVDLDFRYDSTITERQHGDEHITDLIQIYLEKICEMTDGTFKFPIYVLEKPGVNTTDPHVTKDGIHLIFGMTMSYGAQLLLRDKVKEEIANVLEDMPLINDYDKVLDAGISKGTTNWQLFGSRKPGHEAYALVARYITTRATASASIPTLSQCADHGSNQKLLPLLSARNTQYTVAALKPTIIEATQKYVKRRIKKCHVKIISAAAPVHYDFSKLDSLEKCQQVVAEVLEYSKHGNEYYLKQAHDYTMILGERYYDPYDKWIAVGWALKTTGYSLFPTWLLFSSKSEQFTWQNVPDLLTIWNGMDTTRGLTFRSIMYWAKEEDPVRYRKVQHHSIEHYIGKILESDGEWDIAQLVFQKFGDVYKCVNIRNKIWYEYSGGRWHEIDSGTTLRLKLSTDLVSLLRVKLRELMAMMTTSSAKPPTPEDTKEADELRKKVKILNTICLRLRKTSWKQNIMKECCEHFFDRHFMCKLDQNQDLLCFRNGILDIGNGCTFRAGKPQDYMSLCTNTDYVAYDSKDPEYLKIRREIETFMSQYFPDPELKGYMWQHLASVLRGDNRNQTFNIYTGEGRNGKSKLVELMGMILGDYKGTVPITLITQKRGSIGAASPEIAQLRGLRYAVMQEPSKGMKINEGIMKELTGGDPIQGRALFRDTVTFIPQFTLVVCTNHLFDITSNDDGTWRRIRVCDFVSRFVPKPSKKVQDHEFKVDKDIALKFKRWLPVFTSMLVDILKETRGLVKDCDIVMAASQTYKAKQDYFTGFYNERITVCMGKYIKKGDVLNEFTNWYGELYGGKIPKGRELYDFLTKKMGKSNSRGWKGYELRHAYEDDMELEPNAI